MKNVKRILAVLLVLVLAFSLAGCSAFEAKMAQAANNMKKVDNCRTDLDFYLEAELKMAGLSLMDLDMDVSGTLDVDKEHQTARGSFRINMLGEERDALIYMENDGTVQRIYTSDDNGETWRVNNNEIDPDTASSFFDFDSITDLNIENLALLSKIADTFEEYGTTDVHGSEATLYLGRVSLQDFEEVADLTLMRETLSEALQTELTEDDINGIGDLPVIIGIDSKSDMITVFALDMTEVMQGVVAIAMKTYVSEIVGEELGGLDFEALGITLNVKDCELEAELYDFNEVGDVEIPDNVRDSAVLAEKAA